MGPRGRGCLLLVAVILVSARRGDTQEGGRRQQRDEVAWSAYVRSRVLIS